MGIRNCSSISSVHVFVVKSVGADIYKRPFITVGFTAFTLMIPLALTSTAGSIRRLGGKRWSRLHRLVYVSATLGVIHYWWLVKKGNYSPAFDTLVLTVLLLARVAYILIKRVRNPAATLKSA